MAKGKHVSSTRSALLTAWRKSGKQLSLKRFAFDDRDAGRIWLQNKRVNPKAPLKGIGSTRKKKTKQG